MSKNPLGRRYFLTTLFFSALALFSFWSMLENMYVKKQNALYLKLFDEQAIQYESIENSNAKKISDYAKRKKKVETELRAQQLEKKTLQDKLKYLEAANIDFQDKYSELIKKQNNDLKPLPSLKLSDEEFHKLKFYNEEINGTMLTIPQNLYSDRHLTELKEKYLVYMPIASYESIEWVKNYYSDLNFKIICDGNDRRKRCDVNLEKEYTYSNLYLKTYEMMQHFCKNDYKPGKYKFFAKLDFDTVLDKRYLYDVIRYISDNSDRRIYYGFSWPHEDFVEMNGQFYAISGKLVDELCSCNMLHPIRTGEDTYFGKALHQCVRENLLPKDKEIIYIENSRYYCDHGGVETDGVNLKLGRKVANKD
ncbi:hypothetical protein BB561_005684 [Smittium simulii]|uniref:Uncharacterized protein n=1 Tax=Smittium simulii TaxID=133385 RepID=A0A2T9Y924_9FUNG|nr:hypothetical protein BB561_005684 [Smittium simulii]